MEYFVRKLRGEYIIMVRRWVTRGFIFKKTKVVEDRANVFGGVFRGSGILPPQTSFKTLEEALECANKWSDSTKDFDLNGKPIKNEEK